MTQLRRPRKGFSLVEVMIVVVIIGILATVAYPTLNKYLLDTKQTEVKTNLMAIYTAQKIYHAAHQSYADKLTSLNVEIVPDAQYTYSVVVDESGFVATGRSNLDDDATEDIWTINHKRELLNTSDDINS